MDGKITIQCNEIIFAHLKSKLMKKYKEQSLSFYCNNKLLHSKEFNLKVDTQEIIGLRSAFGLKDLLRSQ